MTVVLLACKTIAPFELSVDFFEKSGFFRANLAAARIQHRDEPTATKGLIKIIAGIRYMKSCFAEYQVVRSSS